MKIQILHNTNLRNFPAYETTEEKINWIKENKHLYIAVATLDVDDLDAAYSLSQNGIDEQYPSWIALADAYEGNITYTEDSRSSMVGDIFTVDDKEYLVDCVGFTEIK